MAFNKPANISLVWAQSGSVTKPTDTKIGQGWVVEIPTHTDFNWVLNRQDQFNAHVNQYGIPVWDAQTEYLADKSYVQGSDGNIYKALLTGIGKDPTIEDSYWVLAFIGTNGGNITGDLSVTNLEVTGAVDIPDNALSGDKVAIATDTERGTVELATNAETITGTSTTLATTPASVAAKLNDPSKYVKGETGWRETPDGFIEQWGKTTDIAVHGERTITFTKPMTSIFKVSFACIGASTTSGTGPNIILKTGYSGTTMTIFNDGQDPADGGVFWSVLGV